MIIIVVIRHFIVTKAAVKVDNVEHLMTRRLSEEDKTSRVQSENLFWQRVYACIDINSLFFLPDPECPLGQKKKIVVFRYRRSKKLG